MHVSILVKSVIGDNFMVLEPSGNVKEFTERFEELYGDINLHARIRITIHDSDQLFIAPAR